VANYNQFYKSLDAEPDKGKAFEIFVKWFLKNDPIWSTQVHEIWLWDDYPDRWSPDCGIDLVFNHENGQTWSVQAKAYNPDYYVKLDDIKGFISESNHPLIDRMLLICTTDHLGTRAKLRIKINNVVTFLQTEFEKSKIDFPPNIRELNKAKRKEKPKPEGDYEYQQEAIDNVVSHLKENDRCKLLMACGTGKSYTSLWIKEKLKSKRTLVLVPSLSLLSQLLKDWTFAANKPFEVLCVCSDKTVGKKDYDSLIESTDDLHFPVTSDINDIKKFLKQDKNQVIFCTYQSSPLIAESQKYKRFPDIDLIIADEAHRSAGKVNSAFSTVLYNQKIKASKRIFATATPRIYTSNVKKKSENRGVEIASMDDENLFGKVAHTLSFGESISRGFLTDYKVVIVGIDDQTISEWIENRELVETDTEILTDAQSLASMIGLIKVMNEKKYDLKRIITFHNRIEGAKQFKDEILEVINWIKPTKRPKREIWSEYIEGKMTVDKRNRILKKLKALKGNERGIVSNARCLSEGVDVPALDGIVFFDPRKSPTDIIQAVGRAIRLSKGKKHGVIFIPVFIEEGEDPESKIESSNFKPIWDVVNALKSHDDVLKEELDQFRLELGKKSISTVSSFSGDKIVIDLPISIDQNFANQLRTILVENTTESWMFWYGLLLKFQDENGDCRVKKTFKTDDGYSLGIWVDNQRALAKNGKMSQERMEKFDALEGWDWTPYSSDWEEGFACLKAFMRKNRHCIVLRDHVTPNGFTLGQWVNNQRGRKDDLSQDRLKRLTAIGFVWDVLSYQWKEGFKYLKEYEQEYGDYLVDGKFETPDGFPLGEWVSRQRALAKKGKMSQEHMERLTALDGWVWNAREYKWEKGFNYLKKFKFEHHHCKVPLDYKTTDNDRYPLGNWVSTQRVQAREGTLRKDRKERLTALGFIWNILK